MFRAIVGIVSFSFRICVFAIVALVVFWSTQSKSQKNLPSVSPSDRASEPLASTPYEITARSGRKPNANPSEKTEERDPRESSQIPVSPPVSVIQEKTTSSSSNVERIVPAKRSPVPRAYDAQKISNQHSASQLVRVKLPCGEIGYGVQGECIRCNRCGCSGRIPMVSTSHAHVVSTGIHFQNKQSLSQRIGPVRKLVHRLFKP